MYQVGKGKHVTCGFTRNLWLKRCSHRHWKPSDNDNDFTSDINLYCRTTSPIHTATGNDNDNVHHLMSDDNNFTCKPMVVGSKNRGYFELTLSDVKSLSLSDGFQYRCECYIVTNKNIEIVIVIVVGWFPVAVWIALNFSSSFETCLNYIWPSIWNVLKANYPWSSQGSQG